VRARGRIKGLATAALAAGIIAVLAAGCGSDDDDGNGNGETEAASPALP
jgi:hypothetical protein